MNFIIYKPYNRDCCRLEGILVHTLSTKGLLLFSILQKYKLGQDKELWENTEHSLNIRINVLCQRLCVGIQFSIHTNRNSTHCTTLSYRASLIQKSYITREPFKDFADWSQVCLESTCYMISESIEGGTWNSAKEQCENINASLLSINTDTEWNMLREWFQEEDYILVYIGLKTKVSRKGMI